MLASKQPREDKRWREWPALLLFNPPARFPSGGIDQLQCIEAKLDPIRISLALVKRIRVALRSFFASGLDSKTRHLSEGM